MAFPWLALAMAARSVAKNQLEDKPAEQAERKYQAETAKWSPWTGMKSAYVKPVEGPLSAAFAGGLTGYSMDQSIADGKDAKLDKAEEKQFRKEMLDMRRMEMDTYRRQMGLPAYSAYSGMLYGPTQAGRNDVGETY